MGTKSMVCLICSIMVVSSRRHLLQQNSINADADVVWKMDFDNLNLTKNIPLIALGIGVTCFISIMTASFCYICIKRNQKKEDNDIIGGTQSELLTIFEYKSQKSEEQLNDIDDNESVDENVRMLEI
eukprot:501781_1